MEVLTVYLDTGKVADTATLVVLNGHTANAKPIISAWAFLVLIIL